MPSPDMLAAAAVLIGLIMYTDFAGADFGSGVWTALASGPARGLLLVCCIDGSVTLHRRYLGSRPASVAGQTNPTYRNPVEARVEVA